MMERVNWSSYLYTYGKEIAVDGSPIYEDLTRYNTAER